jgi:CheY-like chemotaxis protein
LQCSLDDNLIGYVDSKKIEKILWNLLSNALKFTNNGGTISLNAQELTFEGKRNLNLVVSDNGIGISENDKRKIFERFFKAQNSTSIYQEGTGIGLAIVKELVEMHHGDIKVDSALNSGTTFTIRLPFGKECYSSNEFVEFKKPDYFEKPEDFEINKHNEEIKHYNLPTLLLVEDNSELREYLAGHFGKKFKVYAAEDGLVGLKLAKENNPDIIVTDIQMPNMNGYEFCKEIRQNFNTSHIPVIMLTANNTVEHQIEGLSTGADAYITKPFDIKIFDAQILSLLENRKSIRKKFLSIETQENLEKSLPQKDVDFIYELKLFIEENLSNVNLNVEFLSDHFAMSLPTLYRKIKSLTGLTPNNLIKTIRLRKAYKLIREEGLRVSEAAYNTGFTDQSYFSTCFKKEFGENPSQIETSSKGLNK